MEWSSNDDIYLHLFGSGAMTHTATAATFWQQWGEDPGGDPSYDREPRIKPQSSMSGGEALPIPEEVSTW